jgi:hypothetical protein
MSWEYTKMSDRDMVHRLLYFALVEMRERGRLANDSVVFHLADLLHNVPLALLKADPASDEDYEQILTSMRQRAQELGCQSWIDQHVSSESQSRESKQDKHRKEVPA